jgi:O-antigen/teichoic acid export membrane protein
MLRQASSYMIAHGVSALLGFSAIVIFTRLLSPEQYGIYVVGMSVAGIVNAILFAWVRLSILRYQSEGEGADVRLAALAGYGLSAALSPLVVLMLFVATSSPWPELALAALVALALGLFEFGQEVLKARQEPGAYMRAAITRAVLTLGISLALVQMGLGGIGLLLGISAAYLACGVIFAPRIWRGPIRGFDGADFKRMAAFGAPMALSGAVFAVHAALDRLIVVQLLGEGAAGVYGASADLVRQIILFPAMAVGSAMVPVVIRSLAEGGKARADGQLLASAELLLAVVLPAVVGLAIVAAPFAALVLGPEFRDIAALLIPILAFAWLFQAITHQYVQVSFHLAKAPHFLLLQGVVLLCVNVAATLLLVPRFGIVGAAWALVIAEAAGVVAGFLFAGRAYPLPLPTGRLVRVFAATMAMAVPTLLIARMPWPDPVFVLIASIVTGIVVYGIAVVLLDVLDLRRQVTTLLRSRLARA